MLRSKAMTLLGLTAAMVKVKAPLSVMLGLGLYTVKARALVEVDDAQAGGS